MPGFANAGQAEILRAAQKDEVFIDKLQKAWLELLLKLGGTRLWMKFKHVNIGNFVYGVATTLSGLQTLGEEYTGIVQVDRTKSSIPKIFRRLVMILLDSFGSVIILSIISRMENYFRNNPFIRQEAKNEILSSFTVLRNIIPFIERLHRASFYTFGMFYHLSKRLTGIQYVLVRRWLKDYQSLYGFKILGGVTFLHLMAVAFNSTWSWFFSPSESGTSSYELPKVPTLKVKDRKCSLCLYDRRNVSATPCGHLFCWSCIMDWLQTQNQCPLCRERVEPSRVVMLQNYL